MPISLNAWQHYEDIVESEQRYAVRTNPKHHLFLFCAGPIANILIPAIHKMHPENTFIDIGSCIDRQLGLMDGDRSYLKKPAGKSLHAVSGINPLEKIRLTAAQRARVN